jgi:hypothetical protein
MEVIMSNLPADFNHRAFDNTIGSRMSRAEEVLAAHREQVMAVCSRAWQEWPLETGAADRWSRVVSALVKTTDALKKCGVNLSKEDIHSMGQILGEAQDANKDGDVEAFKQNIQTYLFIYSVAIEREAA